MSYDPPIDADFTCKHNAMASECSTCHAENPPPPEVQSPQLTVEEAAEKAFHEYNAAAKCDVSYYEKEWTDAYLKGDANGYQRAKAEREREELEFSEKIHLQNSAEKWELITALLQEERARAFEEAYQEWRRKNPDFEPENRYDDFFKDAFYLGFGRGKEAAELLARAARSPGDAEK